MRLLLVEDDAALAEALRQNLRGDGYVVDHVARYGEAEAALMIVPYDLVLLDLGLPDGDGRDLLRDLRRRRCKTKVLVLTARDHVEARVGGLDDGADDYLVKPFAQAELAARIRALLRRPDDSRGRILRCGTLSLDTVTGEVSAPGGSAVLPPKERVILTALLIRPGGVVTRDRLDSQLYGFADEIESNALEAAISRLRLRLSGLKAAVEIRAIRGVGYLLREIAAGRAAP